MASQREHIKAYTHWMREAERLLAAKEARAKEIIDTADPRVDAIAVKFIIAKDDLIKSKQTGIDEALAWATAYALGGILGA